MSSRLGPVPPAAGECRNARGTAWVDNTIRDVLYALRTFKRAPLVSLTIISTVALGLGLVAAVFTLPAAGHQVLVLSLVAFSIPASRAARLDPTRALRLD